MRALITGAAGFVAGHLARELTKAGWEVFGTVLGPVPDSHGSRERSLSGGVADGVAAAAGSLFRGIVECDATSGEHTRRVLDEVCPDHVYHLAGISAVGAAERDRLAAFSANTAGALVLLHELVEYSERTGNPPRVLVVGSAEQYGRHPLEELPLGEDAEQRPLGTYAASKCAQEILARQVHRAHGLDVVCVRSFNHSGAGQRPDFLIPALVQRALRLRETGGRVLPVGNTTPVRDYLHVEDVARAYRLLLLSGVAGDVYNVCSGIGRSVSHIVEAVLRHLQVEAEPSPDPELVRPVDIPALIGNNNKLCSRTGWSAERTFEDILEDLVLAASQ